MCRAFVRMLCVLVVSVFAGDAVVVGDGVGGGDGVYFQSHRGAVGEAPENTLAAVRHAWSVAGAVPEVDLRTTADGAIVCIHDETLARTTDAGEGLRDRPVDSLSLEEVRSCDAGVRFDAVFAGEKVPLLTEIFDTMKEDAARELYLDVKAVDLEQLKGLIEWYGFGARIIFVHGDREECARLLELVEGARTMTWLSGSPEEIRAKFAVVEAAGFRGLSQLQFHLRTMRKKDGSVVFALDDAFLREAVEKTRHAGVALQVRPFEFDRESLARLLDIGIRWFVTDDPEKFGDEVRREK